MKQELDKLAKYNYKRGLEIGFIQGLVVGIVLVMITVLTI